MGADVRTTRRWPTWAAWTVLITGIAANIAVVWMPILRDEGGFLTMGAGMAAGGRLYVDYVEQKPPLLFGMLEWLFRLVGPSLWWARGLVRVEVGAVAALLWFLARRLGWSRPWSAALVGAFLWLDPVFLGYGPYTETIVMVAGTCTLWVLVARGDDVGVGSVFAAGLLIGVAAIGKQVGILFAPAVGLWLFLDDLHGRRSKGAMAARLAALAIGTAVPLAATAAYFWRTGGLGAMVYAVVTFSLRGYQGEPFAEWLYDLARNQLARAFVMWLPAAIIGVVALWRFARRGEDRAMALAALMVAWSLVASLKRPYDHYVISYLPALCLVGVEGWRRWSTRVRPGLAVAAAAVLLVPTARHYVLYVGPDLAADVLGQQIATARHIEAFLEPGEPMYVLGGEDRYYFLTGRYRHHPPVFVVPTNRGLTPPTDLWRRMNGTPGLRYVALVEGELGAVEDIAETVRARSRVAFRARVGNMETVTLYRLPADWATVSLGRPPR